MGPNSLGRWNGEEEGEGGEKGEQQTKWRGVVGERKWMRKGEGGEFQRSGHFLLLLFRRQSTSFLTLRPENQLCIFTGGLKLPVID